METANNLIACQTFACAFWLISAWSSAGTTDIGKHFISFIVFLPCFCLFSLFCLVLKIPNTVLFLLLGIAGLLFPLLRNKQRLERWSEFLRTILIMIAWSAVYHLTLSILQFMTLKVYPEFFASVTALGFSLILLRMLRGILSSVGWRAALALCIVCFGLFAGFCLMRAVNPLFNSPDSEIYYILCLSEGICTASVCSWGFLAFSADEYDRQAKLIQQSSEAVSLHMEMMVRQNRILHDVLNQVLSVYNRLSQNNDPVLLEAFRELMKTLAQVQTEEYCTDPQLNSRIQKLHHIYPDVPFHVQIHYQTSQAEKQKWYPILPDILELLGKSACVSWSGQAPVLIRLTNTSSSVLLLVTDCHLRTEDRIDLCKNAEKAGCTITQTAQGILAVFPVNQIL